MTEKNFMPDILLIQPPVRDFYLTAKRTIPYGLACIASALKHSGFTVTILDALATSKSRIIDFPREMEYLTPYYGKPDLSPFGLFHHFKHFGYSFEHIGKTARESGAFLVGISSLFTAYSDEAIKTAQVVKKFLPKCKIVFGGHHPTAMPEEVMKCNAIDFVIRGEGEAAMPLLAKAIKEIPPAPFAKGGDENPASGIRHPETIPGIVFRKPDGSLHISEPAMMRHPDEYPLPATELVKHSFYKRGKRGSAVITASRGCPMKCSYCSVGASALKYRRRSVQAVLCEIEHAVTRYDAGFIDFEDENLSLEREWFLTLLNEIRQGFAEAKPELRAMNGLFPPSLDEEVICMMKEAGFKTLNLSLGSTSAAQLKRFRRPDVRNAAENAMTLAEKYGLDVVCYIIAGAPGQHAEESVSDLLYFSRKKALVGVSVFYPSPGSADFALCQTAGLLPDRLSLMRSSALPISHTTARLESVTLLRLGRILNFIKSLTDKGIPIPEPSRFTKNDISDLKDRGEIGRRLLSWFLYDGRIRGLTPKGEIFEHVISEKLTKIFISGLCSR